MSTDKVKIGARILSKAALDKLLPSNKNIDEQLKKMRTTAWECSNVSKKDDDIWDKEFDRHFNNIFSILGGRGSGKTSVLLTLKHKLTKEHATTDIILPLIVPEKMGRVSDILGCLLGLLGDVVEEFEHNIFHKEVRKFEKSRDFKDYFENCRKKDNNPLREKYNNLLKQYSYTKSDYRDILLNQYEGLNHYVENAKNILDSDQKLVVRFEDFIDELLKVKRKSISKSEDGKSSDLEPDHEPLLLAFFDDVDLSTDRCAEVLEVILRYLSHSNIVAFVAGYYRMFCEVLTINYLKKDDILNEQMKECFFKETALESKTALEARRILAQDLLKKVMPPAYRYFMPKIDERARAEFIYSTEEDDEKDNSKERKDSENNSPTIIHAYPTITELIIKIFVDKNCNAGDLKNHKDSFLYYNEKPIYAYFKIFDDTPRGLMNVYNFLYQIKDRENNNEKEKCLLLKQFLNTLVYSSNELIDFDYHINRIIDIRECFEDTFIDYKYIESMMDSNKDGSKISSHGVISLFILAHFIERIVIIENKKIYPLSNRKAHGAAVLYNILNSQNKKFFLYPRTSDIDMLLYMHSELYINIPDSNMSNLTEYGEKDYFSGKYFEILNMLVKLRDQSIGEFFRQVQREDALWVNQKVQTIMRHGGGNTIILKEVIEKTYKRIKNMKVDTDIKRIITDKLKTLYENGVKSIQEVLKIDKDIMDIFLTDGTLTDEDIKNLSYLNILEERFDDELLLVEDMNNSLEQHRVITPQIKEKYDNIFNNSDEMSDSTFKKMLRNVFNSDGISEEVHRVMRIEFRNYLRTGVRLVSRKFADDIEDLYDEFKSLPERIVSRDKHELELLVSQSQIPELCVDYVKVKTQIEINDRDRREKEEKSEGKNKETFYQLFTQLYKDLIEDNKLKKFPRFTQYIAEKEKQSKQVNLNV